MPKTLKKRRCNTSIHAVVRADGSRTLRPTTLGSAQSVPQVLLVLDGDVAGRKATKIIAPKLRPRCPVHVVELPVSVQPDQLSMQEIREILAPTIQRRLSLR